MFNKVLLGLASCVLFVGCAYQFGLGNSLLQGKTVSIPYIEGDLDGFLTEAVIGEVSKCLNASYTSGCGEVVLKIKIIDDYEENIGFRYDRKRNGSLRKTIVPIEARATLVAKVEILDSMGKCLMSPVFIKASLDYDHDYYSSRDRINIFSLGQLSDIDSAQDAARRPLNHVLARKIADFLNNAW
ncbi:MAG: hypothetical protein ACSNEK_07775 [Parachlamydiaceae bacterium]